jgi:hypothetical protein
VREASNTIGGSHEASQEFLELLYHRRVILRIVAYKTEDLQTSKPVVAIVRCGIQHTFVSILYSCRHSASFEAR